MISKEQKYSILEEILKSNSFINSKLNAKLLTYLVECEIEGKHPNEYSIAVDVFGKDASFNPNEDTIVRVSVYNLRKKLERYYFNMGKNAKVRVKIPKGHYEVEFFHYSKENLIKKLTDLRIIYPFIILILLAVIIFLLIKLFNYSENIPQNYTGTEKATKLFAEFIESNNPKVISLGDDFIYYSDFSEFNTSIVRKMYRNSAINTDEEFELFRSEKSDRNKYKKLPFSFFNQAAVWPLTGMVQFLTPHDVNYTLRSASTLTTNDIKNNDIIFLGSFWTVGILNNIIKSLGMNYTIIGKETLSLTLPNKKDSTVVLLRTGIPAYEHIDYSLFIKAPGPNNNTIYMIVSFYATGTVAATKYITNDETLSNVAKKLGVSSNEFPKYFYVVFKSNGHNREVLSTEIYFAGKIVPNMIKW